MLASSHLLGIGVGWLGVMQRGPHIMFDLVSDVKVILHLFCHRIVFAEFTLSPHPPSWRGTCKFKVSICVSTVLSVSCCLVGVAVLRIVVDTLCIWLD